MAFHVKQEWDEQYQSESEHLYSSTKLPRLLYELPHQNHSVSAELPLFVPEPNDKMNLSASSTTSATPATTATRFARGVRGFFNLAQWQELELQALIFKYMLIKAPVPLQLINYIKKTLPDNNPAFYLHQPFQQYQYFQQEMLKSGYWGNAIDPEPGRCRRTDGKKWRCAKDVVIGQKYCERHMHRGRNRSRKPVESSSTTPITLSGGQRTLTTSPYAIETTRTRISVAVPAPSPLRTRYQELKLEQGVTEKPCEDSYNGKKIESEQTLRHFFNDCPKSQEEGNNVNINAQPVNFPTGLSISIPEENKPLSDFSLKLAMGNEEDDKKASLQVRSWGNHHHMGGPLAEALRQSGSSSSPKSVLVSQQGTTEQVQI